MVHAIERPGRPVRDARQAFLAKKRDYRAEPRFFMGPFALTLEYEWNPTAVALYPGIGMFGVGGLTGEEISK